jgi:hypothetical protein
MGKPSGQCCRLLPADVKLLGELRRYLFADFRMAPDAIAKYLDIFKHDLPSLLTSGAAMPIQVLRIQCSAATVHRGLAVPVAMLNVRFVNALNAVITNSHSQSGLADAV